MRIIGEIESVAKKALDIGARDGYFSKLLASHYDSVVALDLEKPLLNCAKVTCVKGNATQLAFPDDNFDLIFCAEVLEHIPTNLLEQACKELSRVSRDYILIGVPYKQDIRVGRTTCYACGKKNPPWGHVNTFSEQRLASLFPDYTIKELSFVGSSNTKTNRLSTALMDYAGNPYGTYSQEEPCVHCGQKLSPPPKRTLIQKISTKAAFYINSIQRPFSKPHANWIHILFQKRATK